MFHGEILPSAKCSSVMVLLLFFFFFLGHADALVCLGKRSDPSLEWLEEQRTLGYAGPEGILLRAERT